MSWSLTKKIKSLSLSLSLKLETMVGQFVMHNATNGILSAVDPQLDVLLASGHRRV